MFRQRNDVDDNGLVRRRMFFCRGGSLGTPSRRLARAPAMMFRSIRERSGYALRTALGPAPPISPWFAVASKGDVAIPGSSHAEVDVVAARERKNEKRGKKERKRTTLRAAETRGSLLLTPAQTHELASRGLRVLHVAAALSCVAFFSPGSLSHLLLARDYAAKGEGERSARVVSGSSWSSRHRLSRQGE